MGVAGWRFAHGKRDLSERAAIAAGRRQMTSRDLMAGHFSAAGSDS